MPALTITVVVENAGKNFSAFSPDIPGCATTGKTIHETIANYKEAADFHLESVIEDGLPLPQPKPLEQHLAEGLLAPGAIADEYFISSITLPLPVVAIAA